MEKIAQGAEAVLFKDRGQIIKERLSKGYRIPQLDESLRKFRTRREAKILQRLEELNFPSPHLKDFSDKRMSIIMDFVPGEQLKEVLTQKDVDYKILAKGIGNNIAMLHSNNIIHGDLTTSNMIHADKLSFIDFGLSFFSDKIEDKAVDLFLLDRAIESTHSDLHPAMFEDVIASYKKAYPDAALVLERFKAVKKRGRNKKG